MDKYKKMLVNRIRIMSLVICLSAVLILLNLFGVFKVASTDDFAKAFLAEFQSGLLLSLIIFFTAMIIRYNSVIKDDVRLRKQYNIENDERKKFIRQKAGFPITLISSMVMIFTGIVAGYFNTIVFFSLVACGVFQLNMVALVKLYYLKKF